MHPDSDVVAPVPPPAPPPAISFAHELRRKAFHFATMAIPAGYYFTDRTTALIVLGALLCAALVVEYARLSHAAMNRLFLRYFGALLRDHEAAGYSAATFLLLSSFLAILVFHKDIAMLALLYAIAGDGMAAVIGRRFGRRKIFNKTLEGSLACAGTCVLFSLLIPAVPFWIRLAGALVATISETIPMRSSDNLRIPIISGSLMELMFIAYLRQIPLLPSGEHWIVGVLNVVGTGMP